MTISFHEDMTQPTRPNSRFVFGSNLAGRHGAGSARAAMLHYGAALGVYYGPTGNSFAIPTVDTAIEKLPIEIIQMYIKQLIQYALEHHGEVFFVTRLGCGIAGFTDEQIAGLFNNGHNYHNFDFPIEWRPFLTHTYIPDHV